MCVVCSAVLVCELRTHLEYVILIAFPLQQWLHERAAVLPNTYTVCHVLSTMIWYHREI